MPFATQSGHTATLLRDGTVLMVAGTDDHGPLAVSQVYLSPRAGGGAAPAQHRPGPGGGRDRRLPSRTVASAEVYG